MLKIITNMDLFYYAFKAILNNITGKHKKMNNVSLKNDFSGYIMYGKKTSSKPCADISYPN